MLMDKLDMNAADPSPASPTAGEPDAPMDGPKMKPATLPVSK